LSFLVWNPIYPTNDIRVTQNNITSQYFEYFYFDDLQNIENKIDVLSVTGTIPSTEY